MQYNKIVILQLKVKDFLQYKFTKLLYFYSNKRYRHERVTPYTCTIMLLRVAYVLAVVFASNETIQGDFISPKSVEEIVKASSDPIPNENCKSESISILDDKLVIKRPHGQDGIDYVA